MVSLREWETARPDEGSLLVEQSLAGFPAGRRLAEELSKTGRMEVLELARGLELRATSFVGRILLGGITVTIHPKITGGPLLSLFRYAYGLRNLDLYGAVDFASSSWSFQDLLIHQLAAEAGELLDRGIHRDYERVDSDLASPRGRIDFTRYLQTVQRAQTTLPCVHHPRMEDTLLNRVLLAGLHFAAGLAADGELKGHMRRLSKRLGETVSEQRLDASLIAEAWRSMDRRTVAYEPALALIELLLEGQGVALDEEGSRVRLKGFLFDMNRFFQALLSRFLRENLSGVEVHDEHRLKGMFRYRPGENPLGRRDPVLRPDFVLMRGRQTVAVLDAKYRDLWEQPLPREMLYQLALYALGRTDERASAILYPTVEAAAREQTIVIQEPVWGGERARVTLRPVNLLRVDQLLRAGPAAQPQRAELARELALC
jgi:5-methylcytosine-specific restriction enzyme subunit McrC